MQYLVVFLFSVWMTTSVNIGAGALQSIYDQYVTPAGVDYPGLKAEKAALDQYVKELSGGRPALSDRSPEAKAYWMNAYNAFTLKLIVDNYPIESITDLHGGNPWDVAWIELDGDKFSLNQIEKEILIKGFGDARVHFAINCAAKSCPPLSSTAFTGANVESELERLTSEFLSNTQFNTIKAGGSKISKIFEWYASDFGDVGYFIKKYTGTDPGSLTYHEYDWGLNSQY